MITVFLFGCPGSGKTTAFRCIEMKARERGLPIVRISDYAILHAWSLDAARRNEIRSTVPQGIDILNPTIYDEVIGEVKREYQNYRSAVTNEIIVIDFARWDYGSALQILGKDIIQDVHILFVKAEIETCMQRILKRSADPLTIDDHFTPEYVLEYYRRQGIEEYIAANSTLLEVIYGVPEERIKVIDNASSCSQQELIKKMGAFVDEVIQMEREVVALAR